MSIVIVLLLILIAVELSAIGEVVSDVKRIFVKMVGILEEYEEE